MFGFISSLFHKAAALVTSVLVAVGLVSAPVAPVSEPVLPSTANEAATAILVDQVQPEKPAEPEKSVVVEKKAPAPVLPPPPVVPKVQKMTLPNGTVVEVDASGNVISSGGVAQPVPAPVASLAPVTPAPSSQPPLPAGFFRLPSGLIVNEAGNVVNP